MFIGTPPSALRIYGKHSSLLDETAIVVSVFLGSVLSLLGTVLVILKSSVSNLAVVYLFWGVQCNIGMLLPRVAQKS